MKQNRLNIYRIDMKYIRDLARADDNVLSVSPQVNKSSRPFLGVIVICGEKKYCVPLSSPKEKHKEMKNDVDFTKILDDGKLIGVLNFNNMIPVDDKFIYTVNLKNNPNDTKEERNYKKLLTKQLVFCRQNQDIIVKKANKLG